MIGILEEQAYIGKFMEMILLIARSYFLSHVPILSIF